MRMTCAIGQSGRTFRNTASPAMSKPVVVAAVTVKKVAMPQHDGLRRAGRAAAEIERGEVVAIARRQRPFGGSFQQRLVVETWSAADADDVTEALDLTRQSIERFRQTTHG